MPFAAFIDFQKAYDSIQHSLLWKKLKHYSVNESLLKLLQVIYNGMTSMVRINKTLFTEPFTISCGLQLWGENSVKIIL